MPSAASILVRLRTDIDNGLISLHVALRGLQDDATAGDRALKNFKGGLVGLAPAAIPVAASLAAALGPVVAQLGAAGIAAGVFGAAMAPQFGVMSDAAKAQGKYADAVSKGGAGSKQAVQAQQAYLAAVAAMPPATRTAAAALSILTTQYQDWSKSLAGDTMPVATKAFGILGAVFPKLTPLVTASGTQFQRLENVLAGGMEAPGFDKLTSQFDTFANKSLKASVDEVLHFSRVLSQGDYDKGPLKEFLAYAKDNAPEVKDTLLHLEQALLHIGEAASDAGPGMLTIVNALAKLASAIPTPVLTRMIQLYTALRLLKGTAAGVQVVAGAAGNLTRQLGTMATTSAAAGGGLAGVRAAIGSLSTGTKIAGTLAVIAGLVLVLKGLAGSGKAAPNVDRLTTSLGNLGRTGKVTGEAAKDFGTDLDGLNKAVERLSGGGSGMDHFNDAMNKVFTLGMGKSNSLKSAGKDIDAVDKALANLVQGGNADLAAAAVAKLSAEYAKTGKPASDLTSKLDDYKSALADAKFEADLTAQSQGLFGKQAESVQKQLDAQKQSADGLRQSLQALNDINRAGLNAESDFEQAIDDATKAIKGHHTALKMLDGQLDLNSQASRDAYKPLTDLAAATDAATAAARDQGKSWDTVNGIYARGRDALIKTATQMGLTQAQAKALANQILKTPDKTARLTGNMEDLQRKITQAKAQLKTVPPSKRVAIQGNISQLKNVVRDALAELNKVTGKSIIIRATTVYSSKGTPSNVFHEGGGYAHGGVVGAATGGPRSRMTLVGEAGPELVDLAAGSTVHTANATRQMLAGGGAAQRIELAFVGGSDDFSRAMVTLLQNYVQPRGGDVQIAIMGRSA